MNKQMSWSATSKPKKDADDLSLLTGKWRVGIEVQIGNPAEVIQGPVTVVLNEELPNIRPIDVRPND